MTQRAGDACEARFSKGCSGWGAEAHHIVLRSQGGSNEPENLLWVCSACHSTIHSYPLAARERGLIASRPHHEITRGPPHDD